MLSNRTPSGVPSTIFVMPDLTTSPSTSSTGSPARAAADLDADLADALELGPEHLSCYELEAKPGTRFTHAHGDELERQADAMESYFELVVERLTGAGYRWYETANFCRARSERGTSAPATTSLTGSGATTSGSASARSRRSPGAGGGTRPASPRYMEALAAGPAPEREIEPLSHEVLAA